MLQTVSNHVLVPITCHFWKKYVFWNLHVPHTHTLIYINNKKYIDHFFLFPGALQGVYMTVQWQLQDRWAELKQDGGENDRKSSHCPRCPSNMGELSA